jgi:hypothetical protein
MQVRFCHVNITHIIENNDLSPGNHSLLSLLFLEYIFIRLNSNNFLSD